ncbi:DUF5696 domain-containing protein [Paenibacillus beijingensis]|uniref:Lipoprotein n=1 Tax=Paenibacillus beijingensis TaxID=1126833 RepID=A0A0D5NGR2_9BACL|nr:DUF5696 domain-containing protein [Paenibacillus beijingensis]AJY74315.1 hypothetical protein VN24_06635 [Paenibacillus beijingensis]
MTKHQNRYLAVLSLLLVMVMASACSGGPDQIAVMTETPTEAESGNPDPGLKALSSLNNVAPKLPGLEPVLENDSMRLHISRETAEIAILDKRSGQVWRSNPEGIQEDSLASPYLKGKLSSQISFVYLTQNGQNKNYDSYNDSVKYKQFKIVTTDSGVSVTYHFGNPEKGLESMPLKISKQRFEELLNRLEDKDDKDQLSIRFKFNEDQNVYERREIPKAVVKKLLGIFEKMKYSEEDLAIDNQENGVGGAVESANPKFTVTIQYTLNGDQLIASVDTAAMEETTPPYRIHSISLLENFGAAGKKDDGYIFLPDGSGAIIPFNNGKKLAQPVLLQLYGEDGSIYVSEKFNELEPVRLPVFGIKKNDAAFLAIIEKGDALARLSADISGRLHEYNTVSGQFIILPKDEVRLSKNEILFKTPRKTYNGQLQIRYAFINGDRANYSGMASVYRSYLEKTYAMKKLQPEGDTPFYLELTGSVPKEKDFLGIPYESLVPLSDFEQTKKLIESLNNNEIRNVQVNYKGWFNGGLYHDFPSKVQMDKVLGSREEWESVAKQLQQSGGGLYPDAAFLQVYHDSAGFNPSKDASQYISRRYVQVFEYDRAAFFKHYELFSHYLLTPGKLASTVDGFLSEYRKVNPGGISLRDLGAQVHSEFRWNKEISREETKRIATDQVKRIRKEVPNIMASGGNAYVLPYVSHLLNVPQKSNGFQLAGESVPFYQMAVHGYVEYAGTPFNLADDQDIRVNVLRSIETGSNVYFSWICEDPSVLKDTKYSYLFSSHYKQWFDEAVDAYKEVNAFLKQVRGQAITLHEKLAEGVFRTQYENGIKVTVNYNDKAVVIDGKTIQARDYDVEM